jgi:hypothetical protein
MNAPLSPPPPKRRFIRKLLLGLFVLVVAAVALAPSIVSWSPALRDRLVRKLVGKLKADVTIETLSAGWLDTVQIAGLRVVPPNGEPLVTVERIESERRLWQMVLAPDDLGTFRVERPTVNVELREKGSNFGDAVVEIRDTPKPPFGLQLGGHVRVVDGALRCRSSEHKNPWSIDGLNLGLGWRPASHSESGSAELLVDHGKVLNRRELSIGLCEDLLKFVAPVLARVAQVKGEVTIELDDWRLPWNDFAAGQLSGRVTMHSVDAGPGSLVQSILDLPVLKLLTTRFPVPAFVQLARESTVPFHMQQGHIYHEHLKFSLAGLVDIETNGYVGLDHTLDLTAALGIHPPNPEERNLAVLRTLTTQPWPVRIHGKLGAPQIDASPLGDAGFDLLGRTLDDIQAGNPSIGGRAFNALNNAGIPIAPNDVATLIELFRRQRAQASAQNGPPPQPYTAAKPPTVVPPDDGEPPAPPAAAIRPAPPATPSATGPLSTAPSPPPVDGMQIAVDVLEEIARRRRERLQGQPPPGPMPPGPNGPGVPPEPPPRRPLLRFGLNVLREATAPPPPPAAPSATSPRTP